MLWARRLAPQLFGDLGSLLGEPWYQSLVRSLGRCGLATMASLQKDPPATATALAAIERMTAEIRALAENPPGGPDAMPFVDQLRALVEDGDPVGLRAMVEARTSGH